MPGRHSRTKGKTAEREVVNLARSYGLPTQRTWQKASAENLFERSCDVSICDKPYQVKRRKNGFGVLYDGLENVEGLFVRADGKAWLLVIRAETYLSLLVKG